MDFVILIIVIIGVAICFKKLNNNGKIYRYGLWFFILIALSQIVSLLISAITIYYPIAGTDPKNLGMILALIRFPEQIIRWAGFFVLTFGFYKS